MMPHLTPASFIAAFAASLVAFLALDVLWLTLYAIDMFQREIGPLMRPQPVWSAVVAFYLIFALALTILAVAPAVVEGRHGGALWRGGLFGFAAYATFDLTNHAILAGWPLGMALKDLLWGTCASALASAAGAVAASAVSRSADRSR